MPIGMLLLQRLGSLRAKGRRSGEDSPHGRQVVLLEQMLILHHGDDDGRDDVEGVNLVLGDRLEIVLQVKLWEDDDLVTTEDGGHAHNDKPVNMAVWKQAKRDFSVILAQCVAVRLVVFRYLDRVSN